MVDRHLSPAVCKCLCWQSCWLPLKYWSTCWWSQWRPNSYLYKRLSSSWEGCTDCEFIERMALEFQYTDLRGWSTGLVCEAPERRLICCRSYWLKMHKQHTRNLKNHGLLVESMELATTFVVNGIRNELAALWGTMVFERWDPGLDCSPGASTIVELHVLYHNNGFACQWI